MTGINQGHFDTMLSKKVLNLNSILGPSMLGFTGRLRCSCRGFMYLEINSITDHIDPVIFHYSRYQITYIHVNAAVVL